MYNLIIAEDEVLERKALELIINRNFSTINIIGAVSDGEQAINLAKKTPPHIILMDIEMPGMNGLQCQKIISTLYPQTKTIILTAYDDFKYAQYAVKVHAFDYLLKPAKPSDLVISLNNAIKTLGNDNINTSGFADMINDTSSDCSIINKAIEYINNNYAEKITLSDAASYVHLNSQYLSRYFKSKVGMNFIDYLSKVRIDKAKKFLINTDENIKYISLKVGFIDAAYFSKVFTKMEGVSPNKFRLNTKTQKREKPIIKWKDN